MDFSSSFTFFGMNYYFIAVIISWITSIIICDETKSYLNITGNSTRKIREMLFLLHPMLTVYLPPIRFGLHE